MQKNLKNKEKDNSKAIVVVSSLDQLHFEDNTEDLKKATNLNYIPCKFEVCPNN
jgi:hypothetical protein